MLLSGVETALLLPAPNPFLAFCFFNLIMALLFVSSSSSSSSSSSEGAKPSGSAADERGGLGGEVRSPEGVESTGGVVDDPEERPGDDIGDGGVGAGGCRGKGHGMPSRPEGSRDICRTGDEEASDGGDCEELNRRVEEFIVRMNRSWVAEREALLSTMAVATELSGDSLE